MLTLFRMGLGPPTLAKSFSPVTSTNVEISPKNFLIFSFSPFATQVLIFKAIPSASPKLLNLNQDQSSKKWFFWSNPYIIEVMITSLIEMLLKWNFVCMTAFDLSHVIICFWSENGRENSQKIWFHNLFFKITLF